MRLSPREMEVARLVAEDLTDKEIANILRISIRTVQQVPRPHRAEDRRSTVHRRTPSRHSPMG
jgi:FixJ family two-component response regulator